MDTENLKLFISACETGSLLKVATRKNLSTPTLSRKIKQLEDEIGTTLLKRGRRGVQPTPEGLMLLEKASMLLSLIDDLSDKMKRDSHQQRSGVIKVMGSYSMTAGELLNDIERFLAIEENKNVRVNLMEADKQTIVETVRSGHATIGVFWDATGIFDLETVPYRLDQAAAVAHESHPLAKRKELSYLDLMDYPSVRTKTTRLVEAMLERTGQVDQRLSSNRIEVPSFEALMRLVSTGRYVGACPMQVAETYADVFKLKIIPLVDKWAQRRHVVGCTNIQALNPAERALFDHLKAQA
jgi:DNA-binding transcriptional LysR family regulator